MNLLTKRFFCVFVQVRVAFEEFSGHATQMLARLEEMQETVSRKDFPQDLEGARRMIEEHATLKKKVIKAPIEELDTEGQRQGDYIMFASPSSSFPCAKQN